MEQQVTVIAVEGNEAVVSGRRASACGGCAGKASCATMGSWVERIVELRLPNRIGAEVGDRVLLFVPDNAVLRIAFRLYGLPMLLFIATGLLLRTLALSLGWAHGEAVAALGAIAAVPLYYFWYRSHQASAADGSPAMDVRMLRIIEHAAAGQRVDLAVSSH
jgi:sigma-E factor negative regulatory protein RseC